MEDEEIALIEGRCCAVCKHCFYTGLPGAYACKYKVFTDIFDTCEKWEQIDENSQLWDCPRCFTRTKD